MSAVAVGARGRPGGQQKGVRERVRPPCAPRAATCCRRRCGKKHGQHGYSSRNYKPNPMTERLSCERAVNWWPCECQHSIDREFSDEGPRFPSGVQSSRPCYSWSFGASLAWKSRCDARSSRTRYEQTLFHLRRDQRLEAVPKGPSRALVVVLAIGKRGLISQKQRSLRLCQEMATL